ncbi:MAG: cell division protein SepF [Eubacteriales bacterium]|jgi:cell division inhibitor SepF
MNIFDKFLDAVRLNDDYDDEDDDSFFDDEDDFDEVDEKPKKRFGRHKKEEEAEPEDDPDESSQDTDSDSRFSSSRFSSQKSAPKGPSVRTNSNPKVTPMRRRNVSAASSMEVCVIKPSRVEDYREIADTLLSGCTVVLNLEGIDVELAQRIIDFSSGSCYAIAGGLQKVSSYIFILTPSNVEITGDIQDLLGGSMPAVSSAY